MVNRNRRRGVLVHAACAAVLSSFTVAACFATDDRLASEPNLWNPDEDWPAALSQPPLLDETGLMLAFADATQNGAPPTTATDASTSNLAAASQNPIANMISLPFQNNLNFGAGPDNGIVNVLNIQPVIPINVGDWNIITRTIIPLIYVDSVADGLPEFISGGGDNFGLGDINFTAFVSPADSGTITWGVGPSINLPTATDDLLGSEKWSAGPSIVVLATPKPWVLGVLVRQLWSFAGDDDRASVNQMLVQPFINYNMEDGWYLVTSPIITANWNNDSSNTWLVPVGGGVGKIIRIGEQPVNVQVQAFYNAVKPHNAPDWSMRFQFVLLFPTQQTK